MKTLTVKREWDNAQILLEIDRKEIAITCNADDFVKRFISKLPSFTFVVRDATSKSLVEKAFTETVEELKKESIKAVNRVE